MCLEKIGAMHMPDRLERDLRQQAYAGIG